MRFNAVGFVCDRCTKTYPSSSEHELTDGTVVCSDCYDEDEDTLATDENTVDDGDESDDVRDTPSWIRRKQHTVAEADEWQSNHAHLEFDNPDIERTFMLTDIHIINRDVDADALVEDVLDGDDE